MGESTDGNYASVICFWLSDFYSVFQAKADTIKIAVDQLSRNVAYFRDPHRLLSGSTGRELTDPVLVWVPKKSASQPYVVRVRALLCWF